MGWSKVKEGLAPVRYTRLNGSMPKLSNFRNDLCNHLNMKKRLRERRTFGSISGSTIPTETERVQSVSSECSKRVLHKNQANATISLDVRVCWKCYTCLSTKGAIQCKCRRVRNFNFVKLPYSMGKPPVIPHLSLVLT